MFSALFADTNIRSNSVVSPRGDNTFEESFNHEFHLTHYSYNRRVEGVQVESETYNHNKIPTSLLRKRRNFAVDASGEKQSGRQNIDEHGRNGDEDASGKNEHDNDKKDEKENDNTKTITDKRTLTDPINWFGILVPSSLRLAQGNFKRGENWMKLFLPFVMLTDNADITSLTI
jgi:hypothetical protein